MLFGGFYNPDRLPQKSGHVLGLFIGERIGPISIKKRPTGIMSLEGKMISDHLLSLGKVRPCQMNAPRNASAKFTPDTMSCSCTRYGLATQFAYTHTRCVHKILERSASYIHVFQPAILKLESDNTQSTEIFSLLNKVICNRKSCISEKFFGVKVNQALKNLPPSKQEAFKRNALEVYQISAEYLEKQFNFRPESDLQKITILSLKSKSTFLFENLCEISRIFAVHTDGEQLFSEYCILKEALLKLEPNDELSVDQNWEKSFDKCDAPNLLNTGECAFAIPVSNAFVE